MRSLEAIRRRGDPASKLAMLGSPGIQRLAAKDNAMANTVGTGSYIYELVERFGTLPSGWTLGPLSAVATDSQDQSLCIPTVKIHQC